MSDLACSLTLPPQGCSGSICEKYGLEACTCASQDGKDETELCHVCCMEKSESFAFSPLPGWITLQFFFCPLHCAHCLCLQWIPTLAAAQDRRGWLVSSIRRWPRSPPALPATTSRATAMCSWSAAWWMLTGRWLGWKRPFLTPSSTRT